jgi:hypothetical protein
MKTTSDWRPAFWAAVWTVATGFFMWSDGFSDREKLGAFLVYLALLGTVIYFYAQRVAALRRKGDGKGR